MNPATRALLIALLSLPGMPLPAAPAVDTSLPISIEADRAEIDDRRQISVYTGNVIVKQGGVTVQADTVTVHTRQRELDSISAQGDPVTYEQIEAGEEDIRGRSKQLDYDATSRILILTTDAELWQGINHFSGNRIEYDPNNEKVIANGTPAANGTNGRRVHIILQPKSAEDSQETPRP